MRVKDDTKREALIAATVQVANRIGFAQSSVSKIAKAAGVSPATVYVYFENKDDLLMSTYVEIKRKLGLAFIRDFDEKLPIRDIFARIWHNGFDHVSKHRADFDFTEQFANSPYADVVDMAEVEALYEPVMEAFRRGIRQKIIKDVNFDLLITFMLYPLMILSNQRRCKSLELTDDDLNKAFEMAWDAIRL